MEKPLQRFRFEILARHKENGDTAPVRVRLLRHNDGQEVYWSAAGHTPSRAYGRCRFDGALGIELGEERIPECGKFFVFVVANDEVSGGPPRAESG